MCIGLYFPILYWICNAFHIAVMVDTTSMDIIPPPRVSYVCLHAGNNACSTINPWICIWSMHGLMMSLLNSVGPKQKQKGCHFAEKKTMNMNIYMYGACMVIVSSFNPLRPTQNGCHFAETHEYIAYGAFMIMMSFFNSLGPKQNGCNFAEKNNI